MALSLVPGSLAYRDVYRGSSGSSLLVALSWAGFILGLIAILGMLVSDLILHWIKWDSQAYLELYGLTTLMAISLLHVRARSYYERGLEAASLAYGFFDALFVLGLIGLIHFGVLLPLLDPGRVERIGGLKVGFYEVIFACLVLLIMRPAIHAALRGQERRRRLEIMETRRMIRLLESLSARIEDLSKPLQERGEEELKRSLDVLLRRVEELRESMMSRVTVYARPTGVVQPPPILEPKRVQETSVTAAEVEKIGEGVEAGREPTLPDAAIDNPWMDVLRKRKKKG